MLFDVAWLVRDGGGKEGEERERESVSSFTVVLSQCLPIAAVWLLSEAPILFVEPPSMHAQGVKQFNLVCPSVVVVSMKITRSRDVGVWANCTYNQTVEYVKKLAWLCFKSTTPVHERYKSCIFTGHAYPPHLSMPCTGSTAHAWYQTGSGRRIMKSLLVLYTQGMRPCCYYNSNVAMARGVCALESSCFLKTSADTLRHDCHLPSDTVIHSPLSSGIAIDWFKWLFYM